MIRYARLAAIAACLVSGSLTAAYAGADKLTPDARAFLDVVRANFDGWNVSHSGQLTLAEIETDMQNPDIKGDSAAALAALMWSAKPSKDAPTPKSYRLTDFDAMEQTLSTGKKLKGGFIGHFRGGKAKIGAERHELFADKIPHMTAIRQTSDVDCYFDSAVGSLANQSPELLVKLIHKAPGGKFIVTFPGKAPEKIPTPTDSEIAAYTSTSDGLWFSVLEKAYSEVRKIDPKADTVEPMDAAALHGGSPGSVIALITGHKVQQVKFAVKGVHIADDMFLDQVRAQIGTALKNHLAVAAGKSHHAYAVVAYDPATDSFTLHNPWDSKGKEKMADNEPEQRDPEGLFTLSAARFVANFDAADIEEQALASR